MEKLAEQPEIDFLILADRAEGINGKLYMMGGGWDQLSVVDFNQPVAFSLAIGALIPWMATNEEHPLRIFIEDADGKALPPDLQIKVTAGRPPGSVRGQAFRSIIAVNGLWKLPSPGIYRAVAEIAGSEPKRTVFYVRAATVPRPAP